MSIFIENAKDFILRKKRHESDLDDEDRKWIKRLIKKEIPYSVSKNIVLSIPQSEIILFMARPYEYLGEIEGYTFDHADKLAGPNSIEDKERLIYGTYYAIWKACTSSGHMFVEAWQAKREMKRISTKGFPEDFNFYEYVDVLTVCGKIKNVRSKKRQRLYPMMFHAYEDVAARSIFEPARQRNISISTMESSMGITLSREQRDAVDAISRSGFGVLTGLPGTGKSTVSRLIVEKFKDRKKLLLAPTGVAAKRLAEACLDEAMTCHRAIYTQLGSKEEGPFDKVEFVLIDEASMLDQETFAKVAYFSRGAQLVLVGDDEQLPSVGPGEVLYQSMKSEVPTIRKLTKIFRSDGIINSNAHKISNGEMPTFREGEFELIEDYNLNTIGSLYKDGRTQIITPSWHGEFGAHNINDYVREAPDQFTNYYTNQVYGVGDKIIILKNDYDLMVVNGDQGRIRKIYPDRIMVDMADGRRVLLPEKFFCESVRHSYAVTVHKSQGMEYERVILVWPGDKWSLSRELFYTAVTRAKKEVYILGDIQDIKASISNPRKGSRNSLLWRKMQIVR